MNVSFQEISDFIQAETATKKAISPETRIVEDLGCTGDDFLELMESYSKKFNVSMDGFLWYFHCPDEASLISFWNLGALFFKPPHKRVERIPVTAGMLQTFAHDGEWNIPYPAHILPKYRLDTYFVQLVVLVIGIIVTVLYALASFRTA